MTQFAVLNIHSRAVQIDDDRTYAIVEGGTRYKADPLTSGDGLAIFDTFDEAEEWRASRER